LARERIFNLPGIIVLVVAGLAALHGLREYVLDDVTDGNLLRTLAFVPGRFTYSYDPSGVADIFAAFSGPKGRMQEEAARFFLGDGKPIWWTPLTYSLLHADWMHVGVNCLWLIAFGSPVAQRFGPWRFLGLMAACAVGGAAMHYATHRFDLMPVVGASASVSGAMAAAVRFVFQPGAPLGGRGGPSFHRPALPLLRVFTSRQTLPFLLIWLVVNFLFGFLSAPLGITEGPVAWEAHVGGFLVGLLGFRWFDPPISREDLITWDEPDAAA
jgi:membrane associated rhomboid family serine protease